MIGVSMKTLWSLLMLVLAVSMLIGVINAVRHPAESDIVLILGVLMVFITSLWAGEE